MNLVEKLNDLLLQATTERSHYYKDETISNMFKDMEEKDALLEEKDEEIAALKADKAIWHNCCNDLDAQVRELQSKIAALKAEKDRLRKMIGEIIALVRRVAGAWLLDDVEKITRPLTHIDGKGEQP